MTGVNLSFTVVFIALLAYVGYVDFKRGIIPNVFVLIGLILAAISWAIFPALFIQGLLGGAFGLVVGLFVVIAGKLLKAGTHLIGGGDIKLLLLLGVIVGFPFIMPVIFVGYIMAVLVSGLLWIYRKQIGRRYIFGKMPLAPYWCLMAVTLMITSFFIDFRA